MQLWCDSHSNVAVARKLPVNCSVFSTSVFSLLLSPPRVLTYALLYIHLFVDCIYATMWLRYCYKRDKRHSKSRGRTVAVVLQSSRSCNFGITLRTEPKSLRESGGAEAEVRSHLEPALRSSSSVPPRALYAAVTTTIRLRFDRRSTRVRLPIEGH